MAIWEYKIAPATATGVWTDNVNIYQQPFELDGKACAAHHFSLPISILNNTTNFQNIMTSKFAKIYKTSLVKKYIENGLTKIRANGGNNITPDEDNRYFVTYGVSWESDTSMSAICGGVAYNISAIGGTAALSQIGSVKAKDVIDKARDDYKMLSYTKNQPGGQSQNKMIKGPVYQVMGGVFVDAGGDMYPAHYAQFGDLVSFLWSNTSSLGSEKESTATGEVAGLTVTGGGIKTKGKKKKGKTAKEKRKKYADRQKGRGYQLVVAPGKGKNFLAYNQWLIEYAIANYCLKYEHKGMMRIIKAKAPTFYAGMWMSQDGKGNLINQTLSDWQNELPVIVKEIINHAKRNNVGIFGDRRKVSSSLHSSRHLGEYLKTKISGGTGGWAGTFKQFKKLSSSVRWRYRAYLSSSVTSLACFLYDLVMNFDTKHSNYIGDDKGMINEVTRIPTQNKNLISNKNVIISKAFRKNIKEYKGQKMRSSDINLPGEGKGGRGEKSEKVNKKFKEMPMINAAKTAIKVPSKAEQRWQKLANDLGVFLRSKGYQNVQVEVTRTGMSLAEAYDPSSDRFVGGDYFGLGLAADLKIDVEKDSSNNIVLGRIGTYESSGEYKANEKLAKNKNFIKHMYEFSQKTDNSDITWSGSEGGGSPATGTLGDEGIKKLNNFTVASSATVITNLLDASHVQDLDNLGFTPAEMVNAENRKELYGILLGREELRKDYNPGP